MISEKSKQTIDKWIAKYPKGQQQSAVMEALKLSQIDNGGYLDKKCIEAVADYLDMSVISVAEVATFYENYNHKPVAKYTVRFCHNISCMLNGADNLIDYLEAKINAEKLGELVQVKKVECLGACVGAPMCQINDDYFENLNEQKINEIISGLK